jgi:hypothetical protein
MKQRKYKQAQTQKFDCMLHVERRTAPSVFFSLRICFFSCVYVMTTDYVEEVVRRAGGKNSSSRSELTVPVGKNVKCYLCNKPKPS